MAALGAALDALRLTGRAEVTVARAAPLGGEQILRVAGRRVVLPSDGRPAVPPLDLGSPILAVAAGRDDVLRLVEDATREASDRVAAHRDLLDPVFLPEIERRLALVNERLVTIRCG